MNLTILIEDTLSKFNEDEQNSMIENQFPYLYTKAFKFTEIGSEEYRKNDAFKQPSKNITNAEKETLIRGCEQLLQGIGFNNKTPFKDIGVSGFYMLMELFHFEFLVKKTQYGVELYNTRGTLDTMTFKHKVTQDQITLFNFCNKFSS